MDPDDPTSIIFNKIRTLEPENATKIIGYFLLQDMDKRDLIRIAHGPDTLIQTFCRKAKSDLGLSSSNGFSISRPINIHQLPLSSPKNGFLDFTRNPNPNNPLSPSLTSRTNHNFSSSPFHESSSLFASSSFGDYEQNQFSFLNEHKRSYSASDVEEQGFGPFGGGSSGFRFDDFGSSSGISEREYMCLQREELMRLKLIQQQRMATAKFMAASGSSSMSHEKDINFLLQTRQVSGQFGEESGYYYSPNRHERDDSVSRQIYLTFPAESSFTDEDVSNYFSNFGTVEDVRIPYQQQRMYGFVTFANAESVRIILARGNPHFICDSRVLVKPYKEKGKILQSKRQMQQLQQLIERRNYSPSSSPCGIDERDLYDCHLGPRMLSNKTQEMLKRNAEQQADLQQAIEVELQRRRFLNLHLPEREIESDRHLQRSFSIGSPSHFPPRFNRSLLFQSENNIEETIEGDRNMSEKYFQLNSGEERGNSNDFYERQETSVENTLPDSLFGSPKKSGKTSQTESDTEQNQAA